MMEEIIKKHPVVSYLSTLIVAFGVAWGVTQWFAAQSEERLINLHETQLQQQTNLQEEQQQQANAEARQLREEYEATIAAANVVLSSIAVGTGSDTQYIDVASFTLNPDDPADAERIAQAEQAVQRGQLRHFDVDGFYAPAASGALATPTAALSATPVGPITSVNGWQYDTVTERQLLIDFVGEELATDILDQLGSPDEVVEAFPVHVWDRGEAQHVEGGNTPFPMTLYTRVLAQRVNRDELASMVAPEGSLTYDTITEGDIAGWLLINKVVGNFVLVPSDVKSIQENKNVYYIRLQATFTDVTVNGVKYDRYHWTQEILVIGTREDIYLVQTSLPSASLSSPDAQAIKEWLASFHVLSDD